MRLHALSLCTAISLTISIAAMPTGSPPCHDDSKVMPYKSLPYLSLPPQKSHTEKPEEKPYSPPPPPQKQENPRPEEETYPPAPALKPYLEKLKAEEKPYAAPPLPSPKEEETKSEEKPKSGDKLHAAPSPPSPPSPASKEGKYRREGNSFSPLPPSPPSHLQPNPDMTKTDEKPKPEATTKPEEKPKPGVKIRPQKRPSLEEKGKSDKKQKPQDHKTKGSDKQTPERLDSLGLSSQADSLVGSDSIELPTDERCLVNGYAIDGDECTTELPYARRGISTISWRSVADR